MHFYCGTLVNVIERWCTACWLHWFNELSRSTKVRRESFLHLHIKASNQTWPLVRSPTLSDDFTLFNILGRDLFKKKKIIVRSNCGELLAGDYWESREGALPDCSNGFLQELLCTIIINIEISPNRWVWVKPISHRSRPQSSCKVHCRAANNWRGSRRMLSNDPTQMS